MTNAHWATRTLDLDENIPARKPPPPPADLSADRDKFIMEGGKTRFFYYGSNSAVRGLKVRFCYTKHRNVAGYYLTFTEVWKGRQGSRSNWHGWKTKKAAIEYCLDRLRDSRKPKAERRYVIPRPD